MRRFHVFEVAEAQPPALDDDTTLMVDRIDIDRETPCPGSVSATKSGPDQILADPVRASSPSTAAGCLTSSSAKVA
jgi:hypothetical protein